MIRERAGEVVVTDRIGRGELDHLVLTTGQHFRRGDDLVAAWKELQRESQRPEALGRRGNFGR